MAIPAGMLGASLLSILCPVDYVHDDAAIMALAGIISTG